MNCRVILPILAGGLLILACQSRGGEPRAQAGGNTMAGMPGMAPMAGMSPGAMDSMQADSSIPIDRRLAGRLGIIFARAAVRPLRREIRVVGSLAYAEPRQQFVSARVMGWVEQLFANYAGKPVRKGDPLLALYAPELVNAQEEYLSARRLGDTALTFAARRRLALWDIPPDQVDSLERTGKVRRTMILRAPMSGEIAGKMVTDGQAVQPGDNLFLIADRRVLWVDLAVHQMDARALTVGTPVSILVDALPGRSYDGRITFLYPTLDTTSRTLTARVEVQNRDGALRPGMYATALIHPAVGSVLTVPTPAVLPTGTRNLVFVKRGDGRFVPRAVEVGVRADSLTEIVRGLDAGDEVVASATYLLDSESNLGAAMQGLMLRMGMGLDMGGMKDTAP